jgi:hypothetical protein
MWAALPRESRKACFSKVVLLIAATVALLLTTSCKNDNCDEEREKWKECGLKVLPGTCNECAADCTVEASCSDIMRRFKAGPCNAYTDCLKNCGIDVGCN